MTDVYRFAVFKNTLLNKINGAFEDRILQVANLENGVSSGARRVPSRLGPLSSSEASLILSTLRPLVALLKRSAPFNKPSDLIDLVSQMELICAGQNDVAAPPTLSRPALAHLQSIYLQTQAHCLFHLTFMFQTHIFDRSGRCTCTKHIP